LIFKAIFANSKFGALVKRLQIQRLRIENEAAPTFDALPILEEREEVAVLAMKDLHG
jgi:hypothetical protein